VSDPSSVADGLHHLLDPRIISVQRIGGAIVVGVAAAGSLVALVIRLLSEGGFRLLMVWPLAVLLASWFFWSWPARAYRYTGYRIDDHGIEIRRGVYWRAVINVPRSRVQHIDVTQGPINRRFGLGTLTVYTAGADHAKVDLEGLEHGRALRIRDFLLPSGSSDAV
jgi:membrane protein YdbS with pleckstrin-like domain